MMFLWDLHYFAENFNITPRAIHTGRLAANQVMFERLVNGMKDLEPGLVKGFFLCLRDSEAVRSQTSQWKRNLLIFSSGICLEIAALPYLAAWLGYEATWHASLLTWLFLPLGIVGAYASKFGGDRLVEWLLIVPKLDLKI
jgi:hypothetical protein